MAKFCANCGATMNDNDNICGQCGTPATAGQGAPVTPGPIGGSNGIDFAKLNENNRLVKIGIGVVAVIVVIFVLSKIVGMFSGSYEKTLNKMVNAIEDEDAEALGDVASSIIVAGIEEDDDFSEYVEDSLDSLLDKIEDEVGVIDDISYEIVDEKEWSDRKLEKQFEEYEDEFDDLDLDISDYKKVVELEVKIIAEGEDGDKYRNKVELFAIKESGGWKLVYGGF